MRWVKFILAFQAVATLIIGIAFLIQVFNIDYAYEQQVQQDFTSKGVTSIIDHEKLAKYNKYRETFFKSSYVLILISLMEFIIIWRLFDTGHITENDKEFDFSKSFNT